MELIGCCVVSLILAVPLAIVIAIVSAGNKASLHKVDLDRLTEGERAKWQAYVAQVGRGEVLSWGQKQDVKEWVARGRGRGAR